MADNVKTEEIEQLKQMAETLEQILEVMPEDYSTLHTLYETYIKLEQPKKAFEYLARLADFTLRVQDTAGATFVLQQYDTLGDLGPEVEGLKGKLRVLLTGRGGEPGDKEVNVEGEVKVEVEGEGDAPDMPDLDAEMALAWDLYQEEQLTQDEYSNVLHDLTELSTHAVGVPVSVLHILHDRQFPRFERLMTYLCDKSDIPIISLSSYEENGDLIKALPLHFMTQRGVLPFAAVGDDLLIAILNPCDKIRIRDAEEASGQHCHPYLVPPDEYDLRLTQVKKSLEE